MNRENAKRRVPTNAELEAEDVGSPPESGVLRGLKNLFRVGRFRVSDEVGARKHVAAAPTDNQAPPRTPAPPGGSGSWSASVRSSSLRVPENVGSGKRVDPLPVPRQASKPSAPSTTQISQLEPIEAACASRTSSVVVGELTPHPCGHPRYLLPRPNHLRREPGTHPDHWRHRPHHAPSASRNLFATVAVPATQTIDPLRFLPWGQLPKTV